MLTHTHRVTGRWRLTVQAAWTAAAMAGAAATVLAPVPAAAMSVLQVDLKTLVTTADRVLYGSIRGARVLDQRKQGRGVWTEFTLDVREVWKGDAKLTAKPFSWRHVGGTTADGVTVAVPGMPTFQAGEEVIVILEKTSESWVVSGGPQGKFVVRSNAQGQRSVSREMTDVHFVRRDPSSGQMAAAPKPVTVLRSLDEMRAEIKGYVAAAVKASQPPTAPAKTVK
jgi:hypothetical protein